MDSFFNPYRHNIFWGVHHTLCSYSGAYIKSLKKLQKRSLQKITNSLKIKIPLQFRKKREQHNIFVFKNLVLVFTKTFQKQSRNCFNCLKNSNLSQKMTQVINHSPKLIHVHYRGLQNLWNDLKFYLVKNVLIAPF